MRESLREDEGKSRASSGREEGRLSSTNIYTPEISISSIFDFSGLKLIIEAPFSFTV